MNSYLGGKISPTNEAIIGGIMIPSSIVTLIVPTVVLMTAGDTYSAAFVGPITTAQIILGAMINKHGHKRMNKDMDYHQ